MPLLCGWASQSEKGAINGAKGDQTKKEVRLGSYYNFGQDRVIRFKGRIKRKKAAKAMAALCRNDSIGYGQSDRGSLFLESRRIGWKIKNIPKIRKCNGDCSELCGCAINFAYGKEIVPSSITTASFEAYTTKKYPKRFETVKKLSGIKWKRGDMPLKAGKHIIMVVDI